MLNGAGADARESFPETNCMVITSCNGCQLSKMAGYIVFALYREHTCAKNHTHGSMWGKESLRNSIVLLPSWRRLDM